MSGRIWVGGLGRVGRLVGVLAVSLALLLPWSAPGFANADDFLDASSRYFPIRHSGITVIADRFGHLADDVVEQFDSHQLQHLGYCGADPICPQSARDAGAVYYTRLSVDGKEVLAFYDENGNLVGISETSSAWGDDGGTTAGSGDGSGDGSTDDPLPTGDLVGSLAGELNISGSASYSIPLEVPPAFGGLEPQLSLAYNSDAGSGALGVGWNVAGIDNITRCNRNIALDGRTRAVQLNGNDRFCLKGKRLVAVDGGYGNDGTNYRTRIASFVRVTSRGQVGGGPESFKVETKAGETLYFGENSTSRVADASGAVLTWSLRRVVDAAGNVMLVDYENTDDGHRPTSIRYSEVNPGQQDFVHEIVFQWEQKPNVLTGYVAGMERKIARRLKSIHMDTNGENAWRYVFDYKASGSTGRSLLTSIQRCGKAGEACLPATAIEWQEPDRSIENLYKNRVSVEHDWNLKKNRLVFFDYDGDGDSDILTIIGGNVYGTELCCQGTQNVLKANTVKLRVNEGGTFSTLDVSDWFNTNAIGEAVGGTDVPEPIITPVDFDGDGRQELAILGIPHMGAEYRCGPGMICQDQTFRAKVIDWNGNNFNKTTISQNSSPGGSAYALDMTGDGRQALLSIPSEYCEFGDVCSGKSATHDPKTPPIRLFSYSGSGWSKHSISNSSSVLKDHLGEQDSPHVAITPIDSDGDGVSELLVRRENTTSHLLTPNADGTDFNVENVTYKWGMSKRKWYPSRRVAMALDFNGDGNQDLLLQRKDADGGTTFLLVSNGESFEDRLDVTNLWGMDGIRWNAYRRKATVFDFNQDGMDDVLMQGIDNRSSFMLLSDGDGFRKKGVSEKWGMNMSSWGAQKRMAIVLNVDGDQMPDLLLFAPDGGDYSSWYLQDGYDDPHEAIADRVVGIQEGGLQEYRVDYEIAGLSDAYTPAPESEWSYPQRSLQRGFVIATRSRMSDGIGGWREINHEYRDRRIHHEGFGELGFAQVRQTDLVSDQETISDIHNANQWLAGLTYQIRTRISGQLVRSVTNEYDFANNQPDGVRFPYMKRSIKKKYELDGTHLATVTTENSGYDAWGNVGQVRIATVDHVHEQTWEKITDNTWDGSLREIGRLLASQVTHVHPDGSTMVRSSSFAYDPATNMLVSETVQPGDGAGLEQTTTYELDRWGNEATTTVSGGSLSDPGLPAHLVDWVDRTSSQTTEIDLASGLRRVTVTNAVGHTEVRNYRLSDGVLLSQTGPNGLTTQFEYDPLGRKTRSLLPDGTEATVDRQWGSHPDIPQARYHVTEAATGQPAGTVWYDRLGREVGKTYPGLDGRTVREFSEYDARGAIVRVSRPHYPGDPQYWLESEYDVRGRLVEHSVPLGDAAGGGRAVETRSHAGYVTTITDAEGRATVKERNAQKQLIRVTDALDETVTYRYNAVGDLIETTDPLGRSTTFVYDVRGRKTRMTAPDMGTWQYTYNNFGELIAQTDAKGQAVYIDYDVLGRKIRRDEPEGITRWCYDGDAACGSVTGGYGAAIGKLVEVTGPELDYRETVQFDGLGRPIRKTTWHLGDETEAYPVETTYDDKGRIDSTVYPGGFTLFNDYNPLGYLIRKVTPRDSLSAELDSDIVKAERLARMIARYEAKSADFTTHAALYERMANDYAASGDTVMATKLDEAAAELLALAAELDQAALDAQAELDQLTTDPDIDAETLRVRYGPNGAEPEGLDPESAAARAAAETWLDTAEQHLESAEQAEFNGLIELRDQELALAQNALAMARDAADEADVPEPGDDPTLAELVPQGSTASECTSTDLYEVFWCAESADAEGRISKLHYGNGLVTHRDYETASGQLAGIRTEAAGDPGIVRQDLAYNYDAVNNVTRRDNLVTGIAQDYLYDDNDRLTQARVSLDPFGDGTQTSTYTWAYDAMGNRVSDTRVGTYVYDDPSNPGRLTIAGGDTLNYDANGNVTDYAGKVLTWSSFNKPTRIEADGTIVNFTYGADRSRYRRHEILPDGTTRTTRYVGKAFERTLTADAGGNTTTEDRYFIYAVGRLVAIHTENRTADTATNRFLHRDALGTVTLVTDAMGQVVERYAFRPFGERVVLENADNDYTGVALAGVAPSLKRGFTGHEHIEGVGLIHMNGRVYDPTLGRFLSADPHVQFLDQPRGYNRYVYVQNNPLKYTDPSGYSAQAKKNSARVIAVLVYVLVLYVTESREAAAGISTFVYAKFMGADNKQAFKAGVTAAAVAWLFGELGDYSAEQSSHPGVGGGGDAAWGAGGWKKVAAHALVGGLASEAVGGEFRDGAISAGFAQAFAPKVDYIQGDSNAATASRITAAAVIGGTASSLSGGNFANGAITAAFARMFNDEHGGERKLNSKERLAVLAVNDADWKTVNEVRIMLSGKGPTPEEWDQILERLPNLRAYSLARVTRLGPRSVFGRMLHEDFKRQYLGTLKQAGLEALADIAVNQGKSYVARRLGSRARAWLESTDIVRASRPNALANGWDKYDVIEFYGEQADLK